jgi:hypothetical protein
VFAGGGRNNTCRRGVLPGGGVGCQALGVSSRLRVLAPAALVASVVAGAVLAGCGGDDPGEASSSGSVASVSSSAAEAASESEPVTTDEGTNAPPFPADPEPDTAEASPGAQVTVSDVRIGRHDGFDRVVLEVGGEGQPGWDVRYVDQASSQGSGAAVEVDGEAVLQVTVTGVGYPYATGVEEVPAGERVTAAGTGAVTELVFDATFEGTSVAFVGTTGRTPFRVYLLEAPTRVVLEVAHPS